MSQQNIFVSYYELGTSIFVDLFVSYKNDRMQYQ